MRRIPDAAMRHIETRERRYPEFAVSRNAPLERWIVFCSYTIQTRGTEITRPRTWEGQRDHSEVDMRYPSRCHRLAVHRIRIIWSIPRLAGELVPIGGKRTFKVGSTSHLMCSPFGTSGNYIARIRKDTCGCECEGQTLEVRT